MTRIFAALSLSCIGFLAVPSAISAPTPTPTPQSTEVQQLIDQAEKTFYNYSFPNRLQKTELLLDRIEQINPTEPYAKWARARVMFFTKESFYSAYAPPDQQENLTERKLELAEKCHKYSDECMKLDMKNAECRLMKGSCYAMQGSTWGVGFKTLRVCKPMDMQWEKAMELPSDFNHQGGVTTRDFAMILRAILFRAMPEGFFFRFLAGIRGDKERAYKWMNEAISKPPLTEEPMLLMEKAATTLCYGRRKKDDKIISNGVEILKTGLAMKSRYSMDDLDKRNMLYLLERPEEACNYRREKFEDLSDSAVKSTINADKESNHKAKK